MTSNLEISAASTCVFLMSAAAFAQEPEWQLPRTRWGAPDLQGIRSNETLTPFERPIGQHDKPFVSKEEASAAADGIKNARSRDAQTKTPKTAPPEAGADVGAYNLVWLDFGSKVVSTGRSSLVVDPPDGRVPVRPEAEAWRDAAPGSMNTRAMRVIRQSATSCAKHACRRQIPTNNCPGSYDPQRPR